MSNDICIEICVDNFESVQAAAEAGAPRIELCSSLKEGGLTPSHGFLSVVKKTFGNRLLVFPMIRPRGGDFVYSKQEIEIMLADIEILKNSGADGFVFGCLTADGSVDLNANRMLLEKAKPLPCTFHRAFDMVKDVDSSLNDVIGLGFKRILTSGQAPKAELGIETIRKLVEKADGKIIIMPGAGINTENLAKILESTKVREFHCSASITRQSEMSYRNKSVSMGSLDDSDFTWKISDTLKIKRLIEIAKNFY